VVDVKAAYGSDTPQGPGKCQGLALVQVDGDLVEMHIFGRWLEGCRWRYNLVEFSGPGPFKRVLRGWSGDLVTLIS
jgi:hypothetical protein